MLNRTRAVLLPLMLSVTCGSALHGLTLAAQRAPWPPFTVTALDGSPVASDTLATDRTWLLIHVRPQCAACDAVLAHIDSRQRPSASRIVIVGSGMGAAAVAALARRFPNMSASRWVADPTRAVMAAVDITTSPTVVGLRQERVHWRLAGGLSDERELESILFTWLEQP